MAAHPFIFGSRYLFGRHSGGTVFLNEQWAPLRLYALFKASKTATRSIRVRRSSDNTEQDFGFSGVELDTAGILAFVGAGNGFVTRLYDQSSTPVDAWNTTAAEQPYIVEAGVLCTKNGKPALKATAAQKKKLKINNSVVGTVIQTEIAVASTSSINGNIIQYVTHYGNNEGIIVGGDPAYYFGHGFFHTGTYIDSNVKNTNQNILAFDTSGASPALLASFFINGTVYDNNINIGVKTLKTCSLVGYSASSGTGLVGEFQFYMSFLNSIKADIPALTEQLNEYYGTY